LYYVILKNEIAKTLPATQPVPRARSCAESQIQSSRHRDALPRAKGPALGTEKTRGTHVLCRELLKRALGTAATSRRNVTAVTAVGPAVRCAESPLLALGTEKLCRVPDTGSRQTIKKNQIHTFKPFLHQPTPLKKHMLKFHIKIDIYFVFNNFISF
jgi:hypothetical protein